MPAYTYFLVSAVFHYLGPAFAVLLFARVDPLGVAWLRIATYPLMVSLLPATATVIVLTQIPTVPEALGVVLVIAGVAAHAPAANPERKAFTEAKPG